MDGETGPEALRARGAIEQLYAANWLRIDNRAEQPVGDLFLADGVLFYGDHRWEGRTAIDGFYDPYRASNTVRSRITRHLSVNHHIEPIGEGRFRVRGVVFVFSGIGADLPLLSAAPSGVGDFDDECLVDPQGRARFARRRTTMIFADAGSFDFSSVRT